MVCIKLAGAMARAVVWFYTWAMTIITDLSLNRARWALGDVALEDVQELARRHDVPEVVARLLFLRGVAEPDVEAFLQPTLREHFPDPFRMTAMEEAAGFVAEAVQGGRSIAIFGDFDVDGATSSAILYRYLKACGVGRERHSGFDPESPGASREMDSGMRRDDEEGKDADIPIYIPDRLEEGYGPNKGALDKLKDQGAELVLILDCGTTSFDVIAHGRDIGLDIVVFDHHEAEDELPPANFVVNPKRKDDESGYDMLAACGVVFLFCVALNRVLRDGGFFEGERAEPDLRGFLDVLALGTVCDMVPLLGPNRLFVRHGFQLMAGTRNAGLRALMQSAGIEEAPNPYHAGFVLGPRINAGSRVHQSDLGAKLLSTDDAEQAQGIAITLERCNAERKSIQAQMEREAVEMVEAQGLAGRALILVAQEGWHPGLSGLVAGNLKEKYQKPACVVTYAKGLEGRMEGRGSGRSVAGIHIAQAFIDARAEGLLEKGGGHAMAGGFTVLPEKVEALYEFLEAHVAKQAQAGETQVELALDASLSVRGVNVGLVKMLEEKVGPFGQGFEAPLFLFRNVRMQRVDVVGGSHVRAQFSDWEGGSWMKGMAFRAADTEMGRALLQSSGGGRPIDLVGRLKINSWQGRESAELHIEDAAFPEMEQQAVSG